MHIGLAKLRRDGFVSLNAEEQPGTVTTRPMTFSGNKLFVNAEIAKGGSIQVAVLDSGSKPVGTHSLDASIPVTRDTLKSHIVWKESNQITCPPGKHVRLPFRLIKAKLYSYWIE